MSLSSAQSSKVLPCQSVPYKPPQMLIFFSVNGVPGGVKSIR